MRQRQELRLERPERQSEASQVRKGPVSCAKGCPKGSEKPLRGAQQIFENQIFISKVLFGH